MTSTMTLHTNHGDININIFDNHAPKTVKNILGLADGSVEWTHPATGQKSNDPLYNGTVFHRIIPGFMIQAAIRCNDFQRSYELFEMMKKDNVQLDQVVYNIMINNCMYNYKWDLAYQYTVESFNQNIKIADNLYSLLLQNLTSKYCNLRRNVKADYISHLLKLLKEKNVTLDHHTYQNTAKFFYKFQSKPIHFQQDYYYNQYDYHNY